MEKKKCVQCGKEFVITDSEMQFFDKKNLNYPKRCKECREKNNPHQVKTNTNQRTQREEKIFTIKKTHLILAILLFAISIVFFISKISSGENYIAQGTSYGEDLIQVQPTTQEVSVSENDISNNESLVQEQSTTQEDHVSDISNSEPLVQEQNVAQEVNVPNGFTFKSDSLLQEHFNKHGSEFGYASVSEYESGANAIINSPDALQKREAEDGDSVYYSEAKNELVVLSTQGYIRTYFKPEDGIAYYNRQ